MSDEVQYFAPTIVAGTPKSAPLTFSLAMPARTVRHVRIRFPPGPRGNVGIQLAMAGVNVIPVTAGAFIVADDEVIEWDVDNAPNSGAWQMIGYNTGALPHTIYLSFLVDIPQLTPTGLALAPLVVTA